ncbi:MAG TPA: glucosidase [Polyangiaceae bacterium]
MTIRRTAEHRRLEEAKAGGRKWRRWGTYLSERQWGTVREDYSADGDAWRYFTHEQAVLRAYRWGEDGLLGLTDNRGLVAFCVALWNGKDPILKERLFGLSGPEGNHGEDVKEHYWYLDATPTCSYARGLYKYPHAEFPYAELRERAARAGRDVVETELSDTGVFEGDRYFDVGIEYAKGAPEDICIRISVTNRADVEARLEVLPQIWFRNTWSWVREEEQPPKPLLRAIHHGHGARALELSQGHLGVRWLYVEGDAELLFTENETNAQALYDAPNESPFTKDAFHRYVVDGEEDAVNPAAMGTKGAARFQVALGARETAVIRLRLTDTPRVDPFEDFDAVMTARIEEADELFDATMPPELGPDERRVYRQAIAGLLWTKQYYAFDVDRWLRGDPHYPAPPASRLSGRNREWRHLYNSEVLSMPDKWEYPWYAAWDLAFHCIPMALVDVDFAKEQLELLLREWYMHPNGQLPAYEWSFSDVNPPVHAWAALRVYQIERRMTGRADRGFLESIFHKLMLNFTWWVNRKDAAGNNVFQGGFLGLDNIGVFDRSNALPEGGTLEQADATSWMGMYCLNLLAIALELARENPRYQDVANKFFEHFLYIAHAMNDVGSQGLTLWDDEDGFYYDVLHQTDGSSMPMRLRSMVGIIPLFAVATLDDTVLARFPAFEKRARWFIENRPDYAEHLAVGLDERGAAQRRLLSLVDRSRLERILARLLDEKEFLSPHGVRALSAAHRDEPFDAFLGGMRHRVAYEPGESSSGLFGGNSNWRGPVWFPVNYLLIESLQRFHHYYGDDLRVECPTGSGRMMNLWDVASELSRRLASLYLIGPDGRRPAHGSSELLQRDPHFKDHITFYEYFHGDDGRGLGASHQTGWTALVAKLLDQSPRWRDVGRDTERTGARRSPSMLP